MNKSFVVDSTFVDMRLDRFLRNKLGNLPQSLIEKNLRNGKIKLNKKKVKSSFKLKLNDRIAVFNLNFQHEITRDKVKKTLSKRYEKRNGGYTRIVKAGFRYGDNAPMAIIEFVDRDLEAKRVDRKKKDDKKEATNQEDKKVASSK